MLLDFSVENFLSIDKKIVLSLDCGSGKKLLENIIVLDKRSKVIKSAAIYGANASGKSNIVKAVFFVWDMVLNSSKFNVDTKIQRVPFKLNEDTVEKPSKFDIRFIKNGIKYQYGFSCDEDRIIEEHLYYSPKGKKSVVFERTETDKYRFTDDVDKQELLGKQTIKNTLYLSRATQLGYEKTREAYDFFANDLIINYSPQWTEYTLRRIIEDPILKQKVLDILQKADFGGIENIKVRKKEKKQVSDMPSRDVSVESYEVKFTHTKSLGNGKTEEVEFDITEESEGTKKTLALLGHLFDILDNGKVAFLDEFEQSLHPAITKFLVRLFHSRHNKNNAQLIFTTQDAALLDNRLFRKDQLYLCLKEPNKNTQLVSLLDYDLRQDADFEKAYLGGRLGGIPLIDETLFD
jgi:hypothetical protein